MPITGNRPRLGSVPGRCKVDEGDRAMNRAWIPAGALAGVSVAGLIAMGPLLTDSLGTDLPFPTSVATPTAGEHPGIRAGELQPQRLRRPHEDDPLPGAGASRRRRLPSTPRLPMPARWGTAVARHPPHTSTATHDEREAEAEDDPHQEARELHRLGRRGQQRLRIRGRQQQQDRPRRADLHSRQRALTDSSASPAEPSRATARLVRFGLTGL